MNDTVSGENWFDSGYVSKLKSTGIQDELDMGCKKKKTQDSYKGLGRNNQDRENWVSSYIFLLCFVFQWEGGEYQKLR